MDVFFFFIIFFSYLQQRIIEGKPPIYISALFKPVLAWVFSRYFGSLTPQKYENIIDDY